MASCRYHVVAPLSSSGASSEPHATTPPPPQTTAPIGEGGGLFLPVVPDASRRGEGAVVVPRPGDSAHHHPALLSPQSAFPAAYPGPEQLAIPAGAAHLARRDMTQLMTVPHSAHHHQHHHHNPHHHQHHHIPHGGSVTSAPTSRGESTSSVAVVSPSSRSTAAGPTEGRKSKRAAGCKSTYKHVPHREKAPHLVARRNARERRRVQAVNTAFVRLRRHVPHENRHKRLSKVKTLHFAIDYINYMQRLIHEYDAAVQRAGGGAGGGGRGTAGGGAGGSMGSGEHGPRTVGLPPAVDMVELNSTKENRWMPVNLPPPHGDQARGLYLTPDVYGQYHQG